LINSFFSFPFTEERRDETQHSPQLPQAKVYATDEGAQGNTLA